jgi:hypothetical protein
MPLLSFLPEIYQGIIIMIAGIILLLHTLGIIERGLDYLIMGGAIYMIILGFVKIDGIEKIRKLFTKKK